MRDARIATCAQDPGNCHIYFGVQLRALPTALSLARVTDRTLVLPPFEYYEGQAQVWANSFKATASGRRPLFLPWSELFDIERLREGGVHAVDYDNASVDHVDVALLQTGSAQTSGTSNKASAALAAKAANSLDGVLEPVACRRRPDGLQHNLTFDATGATGEEGRPSGAWLYERRVAFGQLLCGTLGFQRPEIVQALANWFGHAPVAAVFNVGHHLHSRVGSEAHAREHQYLEAHLRPNAQLESEATRFISHAIRKPRVDSASADAAAAGVAAAEAVTDEGTGAARSAAAAAFLAGYQSGADEIGGGFVAVHWRHGDYVQYKLLQSPSTVAGRVRKAIDASRCGPTCPIFLMSNCRNNSALEELSGLLPSEPITYAPIEPRFADEGRKLIVEVAIATRATAFVGSPRSAVTELVDTLRRAREREQRMGRQRSAKTELRALSSLCQSP